MYRTQHKVERSGRIIVHKQTSANLESALICMLRKVYQEYTKQDQIDGTYPNLKNDSRIETDHKTNVTLIVGGNSRHTFTIVTKRGGDPVSFESVEKRDSYIDILLGVP